MSITFYAYLRPDGTGEVTTTPLSGDLFSGYQLISESDSHPGIQGKLYQNGEWVDPPVTDYRLNRRINYPSVPDQLDMLWHAMDDGVLPKVEPFYSEILAVKVRYPKP